MMVIDSQLNSVADKSNLHPVTAPVTTPQSLLISSWLKSVSVGTRSIYLRDWEAFRASCQKPIDEIKLHDIQNFYSSLPGAISSKNRALKSIKSFFSFASRLDMIKSNPTLNQKPTKTRDCLSDRILSQEDVAEIIRLETNVRNKLILEVLYYGGLRVSELAKLKNSDLRRGILTIFGKGGKTRYIKLPNNIANQIAQQQTTTHHPIFNSRKKEGHLSTVQIWHIVKTACRRAGIITASPHWLRHAHASHALDGGAPIHVVQATLGHQSLATTSRYVHIRPDTSSGDYLQSI